MFRAWLLSVPLTCLLTCDAAALSIAYAGSAVPFSLTCSQNALLSPDLVLQVVNESGEDATVLAWQLQLELRPISGAQGELLFQDVSAPPESLFGDTPGPTSDPESDTSAILASDADTSEEFDGELVPNESARNIIQLMIAATPDAVGTFQLVMPEFDSENPEVGSLWFPVDGFEPLAFDNVAASAFSGFVLLGTVTVTQPIQPGDYDADGVVGPLDYDLWRVRFGNTVSAPGDDADGSGNQVVDAADYVIWRANLPPASGAGNMPISSSNVPEPGTAILAGVSLAVGVCLRNRSRQRKSRRPTHLTPPSYYM